MNQTKSMKKYQVPPDGGYGWFVVFAFALTSFIYIPLTHCFGLIFKDTFAELGLSMTQGSLITNLHAAFGMFTGLLNGVLLKIFGFRKIAFVGAALYFFGVTATSFGESFSYFIIFYGLIASLGNGFSRSAYTLAINVYFKKRRSRAMGLAVTITGLGSIVIPQLVNLLMKFYTPEGVLLIFGGICSHFFVAAMLLQPVKWHMREEEQPMVEEPEPQRVIDLEICDSQINLNDHSEKATKEPKKLFSNISNVFDLDLLKDPVFVNILLGMAFVIFAEMNFNILVPFILNDFGLSTDQIAMFMSTTGFTDIVFRFLAPYIGDYIKKPPRHIYIYTLFLLLAMRILFLFSTNFFVLLVVAAGLGVSRGVRRVFLSLIVPSHVAMEKLASASGMEMMANGFCIFTGGFILGLIRDFTGSYRGCIVVMNCMTTLTIIMWTVEAIVVKYFGKSTKNGKIPAENIPINKA